MNQMKLLPIVAALSSAFLPQAYADTPVQEEQVSQLESITIKGRRTVSETPTERLNRQQISREMIRDSRDLVRYSADAGVADDGRRLKGFAIRGVEDNRVGITIDGVALPDSEENSLYARYGNFNSSRLSIDPELVRTIEVTKGSDSIHSGSGALGGTVKYRTLEAADLMSGERDWGGMLKSGYSSKNREWVHTAGMGWIHDQFDLALMYSHRRGHETESRGGDITPKGSYASASALEIERRANHGSARMYPDPSQHRQHSYLAKLGWNITPEQRLSLNINGQDSSNLTNEYTYSLTTYWRDADDTQKRINTNLAYEYTPSEGKLALIRADLDYQKAENATLSYKGNWLTEYDQNYDVIAYTKSGLASKDHRNNITKFGRFSFRADSKPLDFLGSQHELSFKAAAGVRKFKNINHDLDFNERTGEQTDSDVYTIQHPIKTKQYALSFSDKVRFNDVLSGSFGLRYDYEHVKPQDLNGLACGAKSSFGRLCGEVDKGGAKFRNWNWQLGLDAQLNQTWQLGYQIGTGHRVPTASEMYFTFESAFGNWKANPNLKAERSLSQSLNLSGKGQYGSLDLSLYHTRYRNFLYEQETKVVTGDPDCDSFKAYWTGCNGLKTDYYQQMVNLDKGRVYGLEFKGTANINRNWRTSAALGYSRGTLQGEHKVSLLSVQPLKLVLGLDYESDGNKWGVFQRLTFTGTKKAKDAQITEFVNDCLQWGKDLYGDDECKQEQEILKARDFRWLNKRAWVYDLFAYYRPSKNLTIRAGVYNAFDTKYHTWDSLRGINPRSSINTLSIRDYNRGDKQGLERYYAPGRNYAVSLEYKF